MLKLIRLASVALFGASCFAQTTPLFQIEGTVKTAAGIPIAGTAIRMANGTGVTTNALGHYFISVPSGFVGTLQPSLGAYTFVPSMRNYSNVTTHVLQQDFVATPPAIGPAPAPLPAAVTLSAGHMAAGGGWKTTLVLVNQSTATAQVQFQFYDENGEPWSLPLILPQASSSSPILNTVIPANAFVQAETSSIDGPLKMGSVKITAPPGVGGYVRYRYITGQESVAALETRDAPTYLVPFDNTNGQVGALALTNVSDQNAQVATSVRDTNGAVIAAGPLTVPARGHINFVLADRFGAAANRQGTVEFETPVSGKISVVASRFSSAGNYTTIPVLTAPAAGPLTFPHFALGAGWANSMQLVNMDNASSSTRISFFDGAGAALLSPVVLPQVGISLNVTSLVQQMTARGSSLLDVTGTQAFPIRIGYVQVAPTGSVNGVLCYRYPASNDETVIPLEGRDSGSYTVIFDQLNGYLYGLAMANLGSAGANISILVRDDIGTLIAVQRLAFPPGGQTSFLLSDLFPATTNKRGTLEFSTPADGRLSMVPIIVAPNGDFAAVPVLAP